MGSIKPNTPGSDFGEWPLDQLADYIEQTFHRYIRTAVPLIREHLHTLSQTQGANNPTLPEMERLFITATDELERHLRREEVELFPVIQILTTGTADSTDKASPKSVHQTVDHLIREHEAESAFFNRIAHLTSNYAAPAGADNLHTETIGQLREFDKKLRRHIQLENGALFPTALEMAEQAARR